MLQVNTDITITVGGTVLAKFSNIMTELGKHAYIDGGLNNRLSIGSGRHDTIVSTITALKNKLSDATGSWRHTPSSVDVENNMVSRTSTLIVRFPVAQENYSFSEIGITANNNDLQTYALTRNILGDIGTINVLKGEDVLIEYGLTYSIQRTNIDSDGSGIIFYSIPIISGIPVSLPSVASTAYLFLNAPNYSTSLYPTSEGTHITSGITCKKNQGKYSIVFTNTGNRNVAALGNYVGGDSSLLDKIPQYIYLFSNQVTLDSLKSAEFPIELSFSKEL